MNNSSDKSLFKRIHVNSVAAEEIEDEEDRLRLQKELKDELEQEFGDFSEISSTLSGSSCSIHANGGPLSENNRYERCVTDDIFLKNGDKNFEQLEVLYNLRIRENEQLKSEFEAIKYQLNEEKLSLQEALKESKQEIQRIVQSRDEIQKVLVQTTSRFRETEKELFDLRKKCSELELVKNNALHDLEMARITVREQEQRLKIAEKNTHINEEINFDYILKELTMKHKDEVTRLEKSIDDATNVLTEKEAECEKLRENLANQRKDFQSDVSHKTSVIEKLNSRLAYCQSQHEQLLQKKSGDLSKFTEQIDHYVAENELLRKEINVLTESMKQLKLSIAESQKQNNESHFVEIIKDAPVNENLLDGDIHRTRFYAQYQSDIDELKKRNESLELELIDVMQQRDHTKTVMSDLIHNMTLDYKEKMDRLETECVRKIVQIESDALQIQETLKTEASKQFAKEMDATISEFSIIYDGLRVFVGKLDDERLRLVKEIQRFVEEIKNYRLTCHTLYQKYLQAREAGKKMKEELDAHERICRQKIRQFLATLKGIQAWLDEDITAKNGSNTEKLSQLIDATLTNVLQGS